MVSPQQSAKDSQKLADAKLDAPSGDVMADAAAQSKGRLMMKLLPLSSRKPCLLIAWGSIWWWRNGRMKAAPTPGKLLLPQLSAAQCTIPDTRSAASMPSARATPTRQTVVELTPLFTKRSYTLFAVVAARPKNIATPQNSSRA